MNSKFKLSAYRSPKILAVALIGATATCVDHRTPTSSPDSGLESSQTTATLVSAAITQTLLTAGNNTANQKVYSTASISPVPNALITVAVLGHNSTSATASPTLSGGGMTAWTMVAVVPVSGLWTFRVQLLQLGTGGVFIDPDFHAGSEGTRIAAAGYYGYLTVDTRLLANGTHRLALVASDGQSAGVKIVTFKVAN